MHHNGISVKGLCLNLPVVLAVLTVGFAGVSSAFDQNTNQQSDVWEMIFNATGLVATNDADADGFLNRDESLAGTNPFDPASYPAIEDVTVSGLRVSNRFESAAGKLYTLHRSGDSGTWSSVTNVLGSGGLIEPGITTTGDVFQLYRIAVGDTDTDGDSIFDWEEIAVKFDPNQSHTDRYELSDSNRVRNVLNIMSTVTVHVLDGDISERWPDAGVVAIRRAGGLKPITVNFTINGTATRNTDYTTQPDNSIFFPPGIREVWVSFDPVADVDDAESTECRAPRLRRP
jgi:hypothetical protein